MAVEDDSTVQWWTIPEAVDQTGLHEETIRRWAREARVRRRVTKDGGRRRILVDAEQLRAEAGHGKTQKHKANDEAATKGLTPQEEPSIRDRLSVLEEIVRRYRMIDEYRDEIERRHLEIGRQRREIEMLLHAPTSMPNN